MAIKGGEWQKHWDNAKKDFTKATKKKKPKSTIDEKASKKTGLSGLAKDIDKAYAIAISDEVKKKDKKKAVEALITMRRAIDEFRKIGDSYVKDIQTEMTKAKDKDLMNELDVLRKEVEALRDSMISMSKFAESGLKGDGAMDGMAKNIRVAIESNAKQALLFLAQVKAKNDTKVWNAGIQDASRNLYQQVGNVGLLLKKGAKLPNIPDAAPPNEVEWMKDWRNGQLKFEPGQEDLMMAERDKFLKSVQSVVDWLKAG